MDIRNIRELKQTATQRLQTARDAKKIILIYAGIITVLSLVTTVICYWLDSQISQQGGLSNMGTRTLLSTVNTVLPIVSNLAILCLELGFIAATIRISRGLFTSAQTLRAGMPRFWAMIRAGLYMLATYFMACIGSFYLAAMIFVLTPLSREATAILEPVIASATGSTLVLEEAVVMQVADAMIPMFVLFAVLCAAAVIPMSYRYRMVNFVLLDKPHLGAMAAIRESRRMMYRNRFTLLKLDLSLWWYYVLAMIASAICYGDALLPMLGIALPFSPGVAYFLFYGLYLAVQFAIYWFFRNQVGVTYALAYEALKPKEENTGGVVLGNIFQT